MKLFKILALAGLAVFLGATASYAVNVGQANICGLIDSLGNVFRTLRTLAFAGAAFVLMGYAWTFITKGWGDKSLDEAKGKGIGMLIGFGLLFGMGMVMTFLPGTAGCSLPNW